MAEISKIFLPAFTDQSVKFNCHRGNIIRLKVLIINIEMGYFFDGFIHLRDGQEMGII